MNEPGLTILATPKPFRGHIGIIQRNAVTSWTHLRPPLRICLFGKEEGTAEIAAELKVHHLHGIQTNPFGTPLLHDLLHHAREFSRTPLLCYVNCDVILLQEFLDAVVAVSQQLPRFLCVAHRLNVDVTTPLMFDPDWQRSFREEILTRGSAGGPLAIDVFAFPRDLYTDVPSLALGRAWFDQWLIKDALAREVPVVDISRVAQAIHQNHEYAHLEGGQKTAYWGEEAQQNLALYGGIPHAYTLLHVTHELTEGGRLKRVRFRRQRAALRDWLWRAVISPTAGMRRKIGFRRRRAMPDNRTAKA